MTSGGGLATRLLGPDGDRLKLQLLMKQKLVGHERTIAEAFAAVGKLVEVAVDDVIISENGSENDVFLILAGRFSVRVRGSQVAVRQPGDHVGEQALLDPGQIRTASVVALETGLVLKVSEADLNVIAENHHTVWKEMARELSTRLIQRNPLVRGVNEQVQVFIISSAENLWIAEEVRSQLNSNEILCTVWTDGVFRAGTYALEALEAALDEKDFAVAVAAADDFIVTRGSEYVTPRDNVIFELGMFMGRLGRRRTILLEPREEDLKLPSDLAGLITIPYRPGPRAKLPVLLGGACHSIRKIIEERKSEV